MNKALSMIGLCTRARKLVMGAGLACDSVRSGHAVLVCLAADASENTKKKVTNCCTYYEAQLIELNATCEELGHFVGNRSAVSCVAVTDSNFAKAIKESNNR